MTFLPQFKRAPCKIYVIPAFNHENHSKISILAVFQNKKHMKKLLVLSCPPINMWQSPNYKANFDEACYNTPMLSVVGSFWFWFHLGNSKGLNSTCNVW